MYENELYHHGVKGMRWGHRKARPTSGGISGMIRRKQVSNATNDLAKIKVRQKEVHSELKELRGYERNPSRLGKSKVSTAIRRHQINSLERTNAKLTSRAKDNQSALKELKQIEKYQSNKAAKKASQKAAKKAYKQTDEYKAKRAKYIKTGAAVAGTALAVYGAYKLNKYVKTTNFKYHQELGKRAATDYLSNFDRASSKVTNSALDRSVDAYRSGKISGEHLINTRRGIDTRFEVRNRASNIVNQRSSSPLWNRDDERNAQELATRLSTAVKAVRQKEIDKAGTEGFVTAAKNTYKYRKKRY